MQPESSDASKVVQIPSEYRFAFHGQGGTLLLLILKNLVLTVLTLGVYVPWGRTQMRRFFWQNAEFNGQRLQYTGTGLELFKGLLKVIGVYALYIALIATAQVISKNLGAAAAALGALCISVLIPYAIYWSRRYLLSRTRWRGIRMGLVGEAGPFAGMTIKGGILTVVTLGLYYPIWRDNLYKYFINHTQVGTLRLRYESDRREVFGMFIKGALLSLVTLGIYSFWYRADVVRYRAERTWLGEARARSELTGGDLLSIAILTLLALPLTLGLAFPWIVVAIAKLRFKRLRLVGTIDFDAIEQIAADGSPTADSLADALDVGIGI